MFKRILCLFTCLSIANNYFLVSQGRNRHIAQNWFKCLLEQTFSAAFVTYYGKRLLGVSTAQRHCICHTNWCLTSFVPCHLWVPLFHYCSGSIGSFFINTPWLSLNISQDFGKWLNLPGSSMSAFSLSFFGYLVGLKCLCSRIRCWLQSQYHQFCQCLQYCPTNSTSPEMPENTLKKCSSKIDTCFYSLYTFYFGRSELCKCVQSMFCSCFLFKIYVHSPVSLGTLLWDWKF